MTRGTDFLENAIVMVTFAAINSSYRFAFRHTLSSPVLRDCVDPIAFDRYQDVLQLRSDSDQSLSAVR